jgi:hypothetical protein
LSEKKPLTSEEYAKQWAKASKQIEQQNPKLPVIKCLPRAIMNGYKDGLKFWCPYCKTWHLHGRGNGHRAAHCCDKPSEGKRRFDSPFYEHGYIIKMMSKVELKQIRKEIDAYLCFRGGEK